MNFTVIDTHTHTYPKKIVEAAAKNLGEFYNFAIEETGTFSSLIECEKRAGVGGFITLPVATSPAHVDKINSINAENMILGRESGMEAYSFGCMHQDYPDFRSGVLKIKKLGLYGIKIHPDLQETDIDDPRFLDLYGEMQKENLRLFLHCGDKRPEHQHSKPEMVGRIAEMFPKLQICAAHFGGYSVWEDSEKYLMGKYNNVWYDCSASIDKISRGDSLRYFEKCGYDRVMFGSDFPSISPSRVMREFLALGIDKEKQENILCYNARHFLGVSDKE